MPIDLAGLRKMREGITPGPWEFSKMFDVSPVDGSEIDIDDLEPQGNGRWFVSGTIPENRPGTPSGSVPQIAEVYDSFAELLPPQNRELIAAAPTILDALIEQLEWREEVLKTIESVKTDDEDMHWNMAINSVLNELKSKGV